MKQSKPFPVPVRLNYSCHKCPAYCCTYDEIEVTKRDIERLARHFDTDYATAEERFTKVRTWTRRRAAARSTRRVPACAGSSRTLRAAATTSS